MNQTQLHSSPTTSPLEKNKREALRMGLLRPRRQFLLLRRERKSRILGLDAARGIALTGMVAVHALTIENSDGSPTLVHQIASGRAAALFAVLAGISIVIITKRRRVPLSQASGPLAAITVRALAIALVGLIMGYADPRFGAVILPYYAVLFMAAMPLIFLSTRALAVTTVVLVFAGPLVSFWVWSDLPKSLAENADLSVIFTDPAELLSMLTVTGIYPALTWIGYLSAGMVVGRLDLRSNWTAFLVLVSGAVLAISAHFFSWYFIFSRGHINDLYRSARESGSSEEAVDRMMELGGSGPVPDGSLWWLAVAEPHIGSPADLCATIGTALVVLGSMFLIERLSVPGVSTAFNALAALGSMPLTLYVLHIWFMSSEYDTFTPTVGFIVQIVVGIVFSVAWRASAGRGPLEAVVAAISNGAGRLANPSAKDSTTGRHCSDRMAWRDSRK